MKYLSTGNQYRSHDWLAHFGIKGQQWGVRRFQNEDGTLTEEGRRRYMRGLSKEQRDKYESLSVFSKRTVDNQIRKGHDFDEALKIAKRNSVAVSAAVAVSFLNLNPYTRPLMQSAGRFIVRTIKNTKAVRKGALYLERMARRRQAVKKGAMILNKASYAVHGDLDDENALSHSGIKGQKWGVRRFQNEDGTLTEEGKRRYGYYDRPDGSKDYNRLRKDAAKDANEWARAKAYYGEGAGNRRKTLKNRLSEKMKDPDYKAEFERLLQSQNWQKVQSSANRERKVQDTKNFVGKTARGVKNLLLGVGSASMAALAIYNIAKLTGANQHIAKYGKQVISSIGRIARKVKPQVVRGAINPDGRINWGAYR